MLFDAFCRGSIPFYGRKIQCSKKYSTLPRWVARWACLKWTAGQLMIHIQWPMLPTWSPWFITIHIHFPIFDIFQPTTWPHPIFTNKTTSILRGFLCALLAACNPVRYKLTVFTVNALCSLVIIVATNFNIFVLTRQLQESHVSSEASWIYAKFYAYMRRQVEHVAEWGNLQTFETHKVLPPRKVSL